MSAHLLVLETAIAGISVALYRVDEQHVTLEKRAHHFATEGSSARIASIVQNVQGKTSLNGIVIDRGPGSFTGLRIGLAFAAGLGLGTIPVLGVSGLAAARRQLRLPNLLLPSTKTHGFLSRPEGENLVDIRTFEFGGSESWFVVRPWPELTALPLPQAAWQILELAVVLDAALAGMAEQAHEQWPAGFSLTGPEPNYLRLSTAEEKAEGR
jgi:tRNA threonylcarbamoyladenosine biosynthesis protein TsaB